MPIFQRFEKNTQGHDYVVGDIHGCFERLNKMTARIGFDVKKDRLFSVGDLIDRGPENKMVLEVLDLPHFHAIRGNHEQMITEHMPTSVRLSNGGSWYFTEDERSRENIARVFDELPYAMEIDTPDGLVGLCHAECPLSDWNELKAKIDTDEHLRTMILWSRLRSKGLSSQEVANVGLVICGHSPMPAPRQIGNHLFIDTGAVFADGHFTIVDITSNVIYQENKP